MTAGPKAAPVSASSRHPSTAIRVEPAAVAAIAGARHGDPFAVLGPHETAPGEWEIRAILPGALSVSILPDGGGERVPTPRGRACVGLGLVGRREIGAFGTPGVGSASVRCE